MYIDVNDISVTYHQQQKDTTVLDHISLQIEKGEFICLLVY